jgi:hypothetical protein
MPQSPFSKEQNKFIATYYPAWEEAIEQEDNLADWKKKTATTILAHPLFVGKLASRDVDPEYGGDAATWEKVQVV